MTPARWDRMPGEPRKRRARQPRGVPGAGKPRSKARESRQTVTKKPVEPQRWRCMYLFTSPNPDRPSRCREEFDSWAAAQRHADLHGGARIEVVL